MAQISYITNGMASTRTTGIAFAERLRKADHDVRFVSHVDISEAITDAGFGFTRLTERDAIRSSVDDEPVLLRPRAMRTAREVSLNNDEIERAVRGSDLLLIDAEMHYAIIATASMGLPTLLPMVWFSIFKDELLPPLDSMAGPPETPAERQANEAAWSRKQRAGRAVRVRRKLTPQGLADPWRVPGYGTVSHADLAALARRRGYPLEDRTERSHWLWPHTYSDLPVLSFNASEMDFPHRPHPLLSYVGPMIPSKPPPGAGAHASWDAWRRWQEDRARSDNKRPLVYCSLGSYWSADVRFLREVIDVFRRRTDWELVLGLGSTLAPSDLEPVPSNVLLLEWAPQIDVLDAADAAITHGGITSINEAIDRGVPLVVYSTGHMDQNGCAVRVEYHGLGVAGDRTADRSHDLEARLDRVLHSDEIRRRVDDMRSVFRSYREPDVAVERVERELAGKP